MDFSTWGFEAAAAGGGTAEKKDFTFGDLYVNFAVFAFKRNTDIRSTTVSNYLTYSENFANWTQTDSANRFVLVNDQVAPNGSTNVFQYTGHSGTNNYVSQSVSFVNKVGTYSVHAKPGTGLTLEMLIGGGGNNFGYAVNTATNAMVETGTVPSGGSLTGSVQSLSDGWKRIRLTFFSPNLAAPIVRAYPSQMNGKTIYVWGAQLEEGSIATPYIKTEAVSPVLGDQDQKKQFVPGASGFGVSGGTYSSHLPSMLSKRTATAYGTIVIPPIKGTDTRVSAYIENGFNVSGVSAGANSTFDITFAKTLANSNYCVILSAENESDGTAAASDYGAITEHSLLAVDRTYKNTTGFRAVALKQNSTNNSWSRQSVRYQSGYEERIHFMVFGGGTYGQA